MTTPFYQADRFTLLVTNASLQVLGDPITTWTTLDVTLRFNEPGSGYFETPGYGWIRDMLVPGARIVVVRHTYDGAGDGILIAGPIEKWMEERADDGEKGGIGTITVNFAEDLAQVVARQVYPNPAQTPETQTTDAWTFSGNAEVALRTLVNLNAGPGALTDRRMPQLALGTLASVGSTVDITAERMQPMGELMREIAQTGGDLGFRVRQVGTSLLFEVYDPPDKSDEIRFGFNYGNLKYLAYEVSAPTATVVIAGGQGEGADRYVTERINATERAAWGRYEKLLSTPGEDTAALADEGDRELASNAATVRMPSNVVDTDDQRFGIHYGLGDLVAIEYRPSAEYVGMVSSVHMQAWPTAGALFAATIGDQSAQTDPVWAQRMREIETRLGRLERRVKPAVV